MSMYCYQCEQTWGGRACDKLGVCGKEADTAALQDLLVYVAKGISQYAHRAAQLDGRARDVDVFVIEALFTTGTNVNFDPARIEQMLRQAATVRNRAKALYEDACRLSGRTPDTPDGPAQWQQGSDRDALIEQGRRIGIPSRKAAFGDDLAGLMELLTYGLKGMAAYADHALMLGKEEEKVFAFIHEALDYLTRPDPAADGLLALCMR